MEEKVIGFVTHVCKRCSNVARREIPEMRDNCSVCGRFLWRKVILDERASPEPEE